jgi:hypothetical protein
MHPESRPLTYLEYVQLYLNIDRVRTQHAFAVAQGMGVAMSNGNLDESWFDAVAKHPEEARQMTRDANADRRMARALAKKGL